MRAHVLAIAVISGVIVVSLAVGRALTEHLLAATSAAGPSEPGEVMPMSEK